MKDSKSSSIKQKLIEQMRWTQTKDPALAKKQRSLIEQLKEDTSAVPQEDLNNSKSDE